LSKGLVIVESPAKAKTIQKYLGKGFTVEASYGHVKDLPKSSLGVDLENDFETEYVVIPGKEKVLAKLKKLALAADFIYLAPDPDREGEAIAAHLADELGEDSSKKKKGKKAKPKTDDIGDGARIQRVTFNEITKRAVQAAFEHPRDIDRNLVDAQQSTARARPPRRLSGFSAIVGQSPARAFRGTRADGCAAADRRSRTRNQGVREKRILDDRRQPCGQQAAGIRRALSGQGRRED
jgi:5S rRNA maturation endonuclease (ribonuclease M5)